MEKFRTVTYEVHNPKIKNENGVRFAFLADFHGSEFGKNKMEARCHFDCRRYGCAKRRIHTEKGRRITEASGC